MSWTTKFDECQGCGRSDRPHVGYGFCGVCHREHFGDFHGVREKYSAIAGELVVQSCGRIRRSRVSVCAGTVESRWWRDLLSPETRKRLEAMEGKVAP